MSGLKFVSNAIEGEVQTLVVVVNNGTLFCIQNMHVAAICSDQGNGLGALLQKLQVQKHSLNLTCNINHVSISERSEEDGAVINLVFTDVNKNFCSVDLGAATNISVGEICQLDDKSECNDFYLLPCDNMEESLCLALLNEEVLAILDVDQDNKVLSRTKLTSKVQKIISVSQYTALGGSENEEVTSVVILLAPGHITGSEGISTQIVWIGQKSQTFESLHLGTAPFPAVVPAGQPAQLTRVEGEPHDQSLVLAITPRDIVALRYSTQMQALCQTVVSTVTTFASAEGGVGANMAASCTPVELLVNQALQALTSTNTGGNPRGEAYFDACLERFASMTNGGEVLALLGLLLEIPHPPVGYLQKLLYHAEVDTVFAFFLTFLTDITPFF